ncbi:glycosyltransferase family A protein [Salinilacihabitans rarus]|uniref:glycosyltransferase family A protein n=1 Tax=Salinilacihabitans rarus TaxID=2961596 RepID=UPI0020C8C60D|nr:glycosyltransferase family A protein [Salinilacihabitans rarus]
MTTASVVVPTYNRAAVLPRAIDSVLEQTFRDFELVVVDDGSTDETDAVVDDYADDRVTLLSHETNRGPSAARNSGIDAAEGEFVSFLDSDDELKPTFLERSIETLRSESGRCAGTFVALEVCRDGKAVDVHGAAAAMTSPADLGPSVETEARTGGLTVRASALADVGSFDERIGYMDDVALWIRLLRGYRLVGIDDPLYRYHRHDGQLTGNDAEKIAGLTAFLAEFRDELPSSYRAQYRYVLGKSYVRRRELSNAAKAFHKAVMADPRRARSVFQFLFEKGKLQLSYVPSYVRSRATRRFDP